ncbi:hypothetical protein IDJ77_07020 [Mucilaginibacter sp. ZT4R22]|uniref:Uncharacterized protein n=1 Tax=Mucilaginibacter pankratovii TaxID=2772110 RepID=A0ABR7WMM5_9SPHI|nr:hypothetical protein [Mucilaginibacter pankratovii]MBD1363556.1 hypothetical protein [Mucilaginibacter pankratovii]
MKPSMLFPYKSRFIGLALIVAHVPVRAIWEMINPDIDESHKLPVNAGDSALFTNGHLFFIASTLLVLTGLFLVAFAKEKIEDEQISQLRLESLQWAIYVNYFILIMSLVFTNGIDFIDMLRLNLLIPLVFFIVRFRWKLWQLNRLLKKEEV